MRRGCVHFEEPVGHRRGVVEQEAPDCAAHVVRRLDQGWAPKRIQAFMGHASIEMTYDVYGYLFKDAESHALAVAKLEPALLG